MFRRPVSNAKGCIPADTKNKNPEDEVEKSTGAPGVNPDNLAPALPPAVTTDNLAPALLQQSPPTILPQHSLQYLIILSTAYIKAYVLHKLHH